MTVEGNQKTFISMRVLLPTGLDLNWHCAHTLQLGGASKAAAKAFILVIMFVFIFDLVMGISFIIKNTSGDKKRNQYTAQQTQSSTATWETGARHTDNTSLEGWCLFSVGGWYKCLLRKYVSYIWHRQIWSLVEKLAIAQRPLQGCKKIHYFNTTLVIFYLPKPL